MMSVTHAVIAAAGTSLIWGTASLVERLTTDIGEAATTEIRNLTFNDEDAIPELEQLQRAYPGA